MYFEKIKLVFSQAWPVFLSQLFIVLYGVVDTWLIGNSSTYELATLGVSINVFDTLYIVISSILLVMIPVISQKSGANKYSEIGESVRQGCWLALFLSIPVILGLLAPGFLLKITHVSHEGDLNIRKYLAILTLGIPALMLFRVFFCYGSAILQPRVFMFLNLFGLAVKFILSWGLVNGIFGFDKLGAMSCAWSTVAVSWLLLMIAAYLLKYYGSFSIHGIFSKWSWPMLSHQLNFLKIGGPIGIIFFIDYTSLTVMALFICRFGLLAIGSQQIAATISLMLYLIPLSIGSAGSVLIGRALGRNDKKEARSFGYAALFFGASIAIVMSLIMWNQSHFLSSLFTVNKDVISLASVFIKWVAIYHVVDALMTISSASLRSYEKVLLPTVFFGFTLWGIGLFGGYILSFIFLEGAVGFWIALSAAATIAAILVVFYHLVISNKAVSNRSIAFSPDI
jgi:multidrug resistance protein, MATE family